MTITGTTTIIYAEQGCKPASECLVQKQPSRGVHRKMCSDNMQQIFRRPPMPK